MAAWAMFAGLLKVLPGPSNLAARSQWYERAFARDDNSLTVYYGGVGRARGSVMVSIRQGWFEQVEDPISGLVPLVQGWHVSRLDLAADDASPHRASPQALYGMLPAARSRSRLKHRVLTMSAAGDEKLTIGSRVSPRYARLYVKGDRVRHEVELKQDVAGRAWAALASGASLISTWAGEYGRLVRWA